MKNRSENSAGRGQILPVLQVNSHSIDQKSGEICTGQADLQPISFKSDRLLDRVVPESIQSWDIGAGESQVLSHCLSTEHMAILDDGAARAAAKAHQVQLLGSLGIILRAKTNGLIPAARPMIEQLIASGSYLSANLVSAALRKVGE